MIPVVTQQVEIDDKRTKKILKLQAKVKLIYSLTWDVAPTSSRQHHVPIHSMLVLYLRRFCWSTVSMYQETLATCRNCGAHAYTLRHNSRLHSDSTPLMIHQLANLTVVDMYSELLHEQGSSVVVSG